jgi:KDO2-lipid IV(A) lauroyltransferase
MKINHGLEYAVVRILTALVQIFPARLADWIALGLGKLAYLILTSRRRIAMKNLERAFKDELTIQQREQITRKVFVNVARTSVEFARQPVLTFKKITDMITFEGKEHLDRVVSEGKGAIVICPHFGNWELFASWTAASGYPLDLLVGEQHNKYVDRLVISFRQAMGVGIIPIGVASRHIIKSLRANRMVAIVSDQHVAAGGAVVQFFGRPAATPKGPAAFAIKVGAPIICGVLIRQGYKKHHAVIYPPLYPPQTGDNERDILELTQSYTSLFESSIRKNPEQWMWTHRRWKLD